MKLKWLGHSCFILTASNGVKVLMDPFGEGYGYEVPSAEADLVTISHQHRDHNNTGAATGPFTLIDSPGSYDKDGVHITGIAAAHDSVGGSQRGKNTIFKVTMDGVNVCHCGDLGHLLAPGQAREIGKVDVLLLPVGGFFTIDAAMATQVTGQLSPTVIIPMHYKVGGVNLPIQGVEPFVKAMGSARKLDVQEIELTPDNLEKYAGVVVLKYE
jgi:L-ascorbate metabolism protein UlaG (beta-lactamase superfamily)